MSLESDRVGHAIAAIPIAHLLGAILFFWSYCTGFGAHLEAAATAADIFSVSVRDMVLAYIGALVFPGLILAIGLGLGLPTASERIARISDLEQRDRAKGAIAKQRKVALLGLPIAGTVILCVAFYRWYQGSPFPYGLMYGGLNPILLVLWFIIAEKSLVSRTTFEAGSLLIGFLLSLVSSGLDKGQHDRLRVYKDDALAFSHCDSALVMRSVGEYYLAILPDSSKALIDHSCAIKLSVPRSPYEVKARPPAKQAIKPPANQNSPSRAGKISGLPPATNAIGQGQGS